MLYAGCVWWLGDWYFFSKKLAFGRQLLGYFLPAILFLGTTWVATRPAPLDVNFFSVPGSYVDGTTLNGIKWKPEFSRFEVKISNDTSMEYTDFVAFLRTDLLFYESGIQTNTINHCVTAYGRPDTIIAYPTLTTENGKTLALDSGTVVSTYYTIKCDRLAPNSSVDFTFAVAPERMTLANPEWAVMHFDYVGGYRSRSDTPKKCFATCMGDLAVQLNDHGRILFRQSGAQMRELLRQ